MLKIRDAQLTLTIRLKLAIIYKHFYNGRYHDLMTNGSLFSKSIKNFIDLPVSTRVVIGQFSGPYSTVRSAKSKKSRHVKCQRYNKYLTNLVLLVRTVSYGSSFFPGSDLWPEREAVRTSKS